MALFHSRFHRQFVSNFFITIRFLTYTSSGQGSSGCLLCLEERDSMLDQLLTNFTPFLRTLNHLDRHEWLMVYGVLIGFGWYCLRGFGSRAGY